jgi:two-component system sensor histidine kinase and response regulator WspE
MCSAFADDTLVELFRSEVETHSEVLSSALLALERSPGDTSRIDEMMRAAHSIKGAARVVGVDPAVSVAHVMEDCFVAAQKGKLALAPEDVDILLRGVDLLARISAATRNPGVDLAQEFDAPVHAMVGKLQAVLTGTVKRPAAPSAEAPAAATSAAAATAPAAGGVTIIVPEILDAAAADEARRQVIAALGGGAPVVRLDLGATRDLDAQGLALLAALPPHLASCGRPAPELAGVSSEMAVVLRVTGLAGQFTARPALAPEAG